MKLEGIEIGGRRFHVTSGDIICPEYMPRMIMENMPGRLVRFTMSKSNGLSKALYETDTMKTVREYLLENGADEKWIKLFLMSQDGLLAVCGDLLVDPDYIMLDADAIFCSEDFSRIGYVFNPFECDNFKDAGKRLLAEIAGNFYMDHGVTGEVFRERFLRELGRRNFSIRNLLAKWEELKSGDFKEEPVVPNFTADNVYKGKEILKRFLNKLSSKEAEENATAAIPKSDGSLFLAGLCNINARIPIKEEGVTIGRVMLQKEYGLYNSGIGKTHARVYERDGGVYATDLGSKNGTYLNGEPLEKRTPARIEKGDILAFSDEEFILC